MATTRSPPGDATDAAAVAAACRDAAFVHLVARADGDALAAAGTLAVACAATHVPYQVSAVRTRDELDARIDATDPSATPLAVGATSPGVGSIAASPASVPAHDAAVELGADPDPVLALAGVVAAGALPGEVCAGALDRADLDRRPGVAVPVPDAADGLAHTTLAHADFSGDVDAARAAVGDADPDDDADRRRIASLLAVAAAGAPDATERAAVAVERALRPYVGGPFETVGGYADVLGALARRAPGLGVAVALGRDAHTEAVDAWRDHARAAHRAVGDASTARYDGLLVARVDGAVETAARLLRDFRSSEPAVLAVAEGEAGIAAVDAPAGEALETAADAVGGSALGRGTRGYARFDAGIEPLVEAVREAL